MTGFWAKPDSSIEYYVTATDSKGCQKIGSPYYFINVNTLGTESFTEENPTISIFPNPTSDKIFINSPENVTIQKIELISINGEKVAIQNNNLEFITLKDYSDGVYIVKIQTSNENIVYRRIVKGN